MTNNLQFTTWAAMSSSAPQFLCQIHCVSHVHHSGYIFYILYFCITQWRMLIICPKFTWWKMLLLLHSLSVKWTTQWAILFIRFFLFKLNARMTVLSQFSPHHQSSIIIKMSHVGEISWRDTKKKQKNKFQVLRVYFCFKVGHFRSQVAIQQTVVFGTLPSFLTTEIAAHYKESSRNLYA